VHTDKSTEWISYSLWVVSIWSIVGSRKVTDAYVYLCIHTKLHDKLTKRLTNHRLRAQNAYSCLKVSPHFYCSCVLSVVDQQKPDPAQTWLRAQGPKTDTRGYQLPSQKYGAVARTLCLCSSSHFWSVKILQWKWGFKCTHDPTGGSMWLCCYDCCGTCHARLMNVKNATILLVLAHYSQLVRNMLYWMRYLYLIPN
jgi:hypothetical protein